MSSLALDNAPKLSLLDTQNETEGNLDPLGLYAIADSLGVQLAPGVRERQSHPRYLTGMAIAATVCQYFEHDEVASDNVSSPAQVFEWYMVEGLVRAADPVTLRGLPGRDKVGKAITDHVPLSAASYLKTPTVFGFHGVYRLLAKTIDIVEDEQLGEAGYRLVSAWEQEQKLDGFLSLVSGEGKGLRESLTSAVKDGLEKGAAARKPGWSGWSFFNDYLHPATFGKKEAKVIAEALLDVKAEGRATILQFLIHSNGQKAWQNRSEREFHLALRKTQSGRLAELLDAIALYETFSRLLQDAFDDALYHLSQSRHPVALTEIASLERIIRAAREVPALYQELSDRLQPFNESIRFVQAFKVFADKHTVDDWVQVLFEHHRRIQNNKPPNGRAPWLDWFDHGKVLVRPAYRDKKARPDNDSYLHAYRTTPLHSFVLDLGLI